MNSLVSVEIVPTLDDITRFTYVVVDSVDVVEAAALNTRVREMTGNFWLTVSAGPRGFVFYDSSSEPCTDLTTASRAAFHALPRRVKFHSDAAVFLKFLMTNDESLLENHSTSDLVVFRATLGRYTNATSSIIAGLISQDIVKVISET
jgi:hypothetical protein